MRQKTINQFYNYFSINKLLYETKSSINNIIIGSPIFFGIGIFIFYSLGFEPSKKFISLSIISLGLIYRFTKIFKIATLIALGFTWAFITTPETPMLNNDIYKASIIGRVESFEINNDLYRLMLDNVELQNYHWPDYLKDNLKPFHKIKIIGKYEGDLEKLWYTILKGSIVNVNANLSAFDNKLSPNSIDFAKDAFLKGTFALGKTNRAPQIITNPDLSISWRDKLSRAIQSKIGGEEGAIIKALVTGDRSFISNETKQNFGDSGIAHILAISGLHVGFVGSIAFVILRKILARFPKLALNYSIKKFSAVFAFILINFYMAVAGFAVPVIRAVIMYTITMIGIIFDRKAFTIRNLSWAALIIIILDPSAIFNISFQLSFSAVVGLMSFYNNKELISTYLQKVPKALRSVINTMISTGLATLATIPFSITSFGYYSLNAFFANMLVIPLTGFITIPATMLGLFLWMFNLEDPAFWIAKCSIKLMIYIANMASKFPLSHIIAVPKGEITLIVFILSGLWFVIISNKSRFVGLFFGSIAFLKILMQEPCDILIENHKTHQDISVRLDDTIYVSGYPTKGLKASSCKNNMASKYSKKLEESPEAVSLLENVHNILKNQNMDMNQEGFYEFYLKKGVVKFIPFKQNRKWGGRAAAAPSSYS